MFKILDGREAFYQWDLEQKLIVDDRSITQVHFCNRTDDCALTCETYELDGLWVVNVPNILFQDNWRIRVYAYDGYATKHEQRFDVIARTKPDTYVYTETEVLNYQTLLDKMTAIEEDIAGTVEEYLKENPVEVDLTGYATETYVNEAVSNVKVDLTGYATEKYVDDAVSAIDIPETDLTGYATEEYVNTAIDNIEHPTTDLTGYATEEYVDNAIANIEIPESTGGASVEEVYVGSETPTDVNIKLWVNPDEDVNYATETYVDEAIANIDIPESSGSSKTVVNFIASGGGVTEEQLAIINDIKTVYRNGGFQEVCQHYDIYCNNNRVISMRVSNSYTVFQYIDISDTDLMSPQGDVKEMYFQNTVGAMIYLYNSTILTDMNYSNYISGGGSGWSYPQNNVDSNLYNAKELLIMWQENSVGYWVSSHVAFANGETLGSHWSNVSFMATIPYEQLSNSSNLYWWYDGSGIWVNNNQQGPIIFYKT